MRKTLISLIALAVTVPLVAVLAGQKPPAGTTFNVSADVRIVLPEGKPGTLTDLKVGDKIRITYHGDVTNAVIEEIHIIVPPKSGDKANRAHGGGKVADGTTHLHGTITAVDPKTRTVTVKVQQQKPPQRPPS